jgi:hypothetical protein
MGNVRSILSAPDQVRVLSLLPSSLLVLSFSLVSSSSLRQTQVTIPSTYTVPPFPSLYAPKPNSEGAIYLYFAEGPFSSSLPLLLLPLLPRYPRPSSLTSSGLVDMWRFTLYWTLIIFAAIFLSASLWACVVFARRHLLLALFIPVIGLTIGVAFGSLSSLFVGKLLDLCVSGCVG